MDICKVTTTKMEVHFIYIYLEHGVILVFFFQRPQRRQSSLPSHSGWNTSSYLLVPLYRIRMTFVRTYLFVYLLINQINQSLYLRSTVVSPFFHPIWWRWSCWYCFSPLAKEPHLAQQIRMPDLTHMYVCIYII